MATTAVVAGTASAVRGRTEHRQQQKWAAESQEQAAQQQQAYDQQAQAAGPAEPDYMAELERLAGLKTQGIITEEEFQAKKR
ncbi:MAG TPA: SHOCT domain-containing protein, partial [Dehalococcoidia bacterium]|nr:SHOCT domain-containing protein [Dehalococcoidia bacterium]